MILCDKISSTFDQKSSQRPLGPRARPAQKGEFGQCAQATQHAARVRSRGERAILDSMGYGQARTQRPMHAVWYRLSIYVVYLYANQQFSKSNGNGKGKGTADRRWCAVLAIGAES